ncbi:MAG TPA: GxxExxY protein [Chitinophagales bacterium]|nr:GxxExxY protein [Chitinophagales bacterium]
MHFNREFEIDVVYRDEHIGNGLVDFLVEDLISVELKARPVMEDLHIAQAINYLKAYNLKVAIRINFGEPSLHFNRLAIKKFNPKP